LIKAPVYKTILEKVTRILKKHRTYRNKQMQATGDGDHAGDEDILETNEQNRERMQREALYDDALEQWEDYERGKTVIYVCIHSTVYIY